MHASAYRTAERFRDVYLQRLTCALSILDVGAYNVNGSLRPIFTAPQWRYVGCDIRSGPGVDVVVAEYDWTAARVAIAGELFDVVVSSSCLEHVPEPWHWINEAARTLRPGGLLYVNAPHTWGFHEEPMDCWRLWPSGLRALCTLGGLDILDLGMTFQGDHPGWGDTHGVARKPEGG